MGGDRSSQVPNASPRGHPVERESERRDVAAFLSIFFFCSDKKEKRLEKEAIGKGETEKQRREREWGGGGHKGTDTNLTGGEVWGAWTDTHQFTKLRQPKTLDTNIFFPLLA